MLHDNYKITYKINKVNKNVSNHSTYLNGSELFQFIKKVMKRKDPLSYIKSFLYSALNINDYSSFEYIIVDAKSHSSYEFTIVKDSCEMAIDLDNISHSFYCYL